MAHRAAEMRELPAEPACSWHDVTNMLMSLNRFSPKHLTCSCYGKQQAVGLIASKTLSG